MKEKKTQTALITGATSGIGLELAKQLGNNGYDLVIVAQDRQKLEATKRLLESTGITVATITQDLAQENAAQYVCDQLAVKKIEIDVLVNNAGFGDFGPFDESDWKKINDMMHLNIITLTHLTRLLLPGMRTRRHGKILNVASTAAFRAGPLMSVYYASKAFVLSFSEGIGEELEGSGVTVTALCPGATASGFQKASQMEHSALVKGRTLASAKEVAAYGYRAMEQGKRVAIHGWSNKFLIFLTRLLPRRFSARVIRFLQRAVQ